MQRVSVGGSHPKRSLVERDQAGIWPAENGFPLHHFGFSAMRRCLCCFAMVLFLLLVCGPTHNGPLTVFPQWGQITFCRSTRSRHTCLLNGSTLIKKILLQRSQSNSCGCSGLLSFTPRSGIMVYPSSSGTVFDAVFVVLRQGQFETIEKSRGNGYRFALISPLPHFPPLRGQSRRLFILPHSKGQWRIARFFSMGCSPYGTIARGSHSLWQ